MRGEGRKERKEGGRRERRTEKVEVGREKRREKEGGRRRERGEKEEKKEGEM